MCITSTTKYKLEYTKIENGEHKNVGTGMQLWWAREGKESYRQRKRWKTNNSELIWLIQHLSPAASFAHSFNCWSVCIFMERFLVIIKFSVFCVCFLSQHFLYVQFVVVPGLFLYLSLLLSFVGCCCFFYSFNRWTCEKNCFIQSPSEIPFPSHVLCKCVCFWVNVLYENVTC